MPILTTARRGLQGYRNGSSSIPVYSFVTSGALSPAQACGCRKRKRGGLRGLGQDEGDLTDSGSYGFDTGSGSGAAPIAVPAGYGYGPSQGGGVALYPAGSGNTGPYATPADISGNPVAMPVNTQAYSVSSTGVTPLLSYTSGGGSLNVAGSSPSTWSSSTWLLLGGAALLGIVALSAGGKRR